MFHENGQGYCETFETSDGWMCTRGQPCNPADEEACTCESQLCSECQDQDDDAWYDCEGDCNDTPNNLVAFNTHPGADEDCDGVDNDCNGIIDDGCVVCDPPEWYLQWCHDENYVMQEGCFCGPTPILVDTLGDGFDLSNSNAGVTFDINGDGQADRVSWTSPGSDDAWLALDRNGNGRIDNGSELFGNATSQPSSTDPNGFIALAEFDKAANGGNKDGVIDSHDSVFAFLRLWQDRNHDGISNPSELMTLSQIGFKTLELDYKTSKRTDQYGNRFRYRAKVGDVRGAQLGRWAWDVVLVVKPG